MRSVNRHSQWRPETWPLISEQGIVLKNIGLAGAIIGIALAHGIVLYRIDTGLRSDGITPTIASRSHRAFW